MKKIYNELEFKNKDKFKSNCNKLQIKITIIKYENDLSHMKSMLINHKKLI